MIGKFFTRLMSGLMTVAAGVPLFLAASFLLLLSGLAVLASADEVDVNAKVQEPQEPQGYVAVMEMSMMILPGTQSYLESAIAAADRDGAKMLIIKLDTPGGMLTTSQEMIKMILASPVPIAVYVAPSGGSATSAGVFITLAGHIAAMSPGTSIGAAHPVAGTGQDIEGDMRQKAENITIAMVKSIAEQRGRDVAWAELAVKESASLTEREAVEKNVVDFVAADLSELLQKAAGREVELPSGKIKLGDYTHLPRQAYNISFKDKSLNVLANPNIAALLWLGATTGLSLELYNPGAIVPGVVGVICLLLALLVTQIIPINQGAIALLVVGAGLIGAELWVASGILGIGGIIAMTLGALYLVDISEAPGLAAVSYQVIIPTAVTLGIFMLLVVATALKVFNRQAATGFEGMIGKQGRAMYGFDMQGKVFVNGEVWNAELQGEPVLKDDPVEVVGHSGGLLLEVRKL